MMVRKQSRLDGLEQFHLQTRLELREWLSAHHLTFSGIWLVRYRPNTGKPHLPNSDIVEELLCFGWIDSRLVTLDETRNMLLCTPRRSHSTWAKSNKERVERLTAAGLMQPKGLKVVARAHEDGSWDFLNEVDAMVEPDDLRDALGVVAGATSYWKAFPPSCRQQVLYWLLTAKRPQTRRVRIGRVVAAAAVNTRIWDVTRPREVQDGKSALRLGVIRTVD